MFIKYLDCSGVKGILELTTDCLAELIADGKGILSTSSTGSTLLNIKNNFGIVKREWEKCI